MNYYILKSFLLLQNKMKISETINMMWNEGVDE